MGGHTPGGRPQIAVAAIIALVVASSVGPTAAHSQAAQAQCNEKSWIAGSVDLCGGTLVYRDYVFDDYGADSGQPGAQSTAPLSNPAGDQRYTEDVNSADIVDLTLTIEGGTLQVEVELNALYNPDSTLVAIAIDSDDDASTGGGAWADLGVASEGWDVLETFTEGDPKTNLITGSMPLPDGERWRVQALTAINGGAVMNVAFRGTDETTSTTTGKWFEDKQAAALRAGDISEFGYTVDVADMKNGVTRPAELVPGYHERVYTSKYTLEPGEGMSYTSQFGRHGDTGNVCEQEFHFFGRYQPYGIYVPDQAGPHGMQLALHGCSANHASLIDADGMQARLGDDVNRIIVNPLGRGPLGYYSDISERDVLDVMADVEATYDIDPDQVFAGGYSMGGYGSYRMATLYPDRFAGAIVWVGFTGDCFNGTPASEQGDCKSGAIGNVINYVRNLRYVPTAMLYMGEDELVHASSWAEMEARFLELESPYIFYKHPAGEHFTLALADDWTKEATYTTGLTRVEDPARVVFRTAKHLGNPEYGIRHDHAYWVSKIRGHHPRFIDVDLTSFGCGKAVPELQAGEAEGPDPVPWVASLRELVGASETKPANELTGKVRNVASLRIDVERACLDAGPITYEIEHKLPIVIHFSDGRTLNLAKGETQGTLR